MISLFKKKTDAKLEERIALTTSSKKKEEEVFQFTPRNLVAGRLPFVKGYERDSIYHAAESLLNCGQVRFIYSIKDGFVYWIAAPASEFGNNIDSASPIEAALPGIKEHMGDGAYIIQSSQTINTIVVKNERGLCSYSGPPAMVAKFNAQEGNDDIFYPTKGKMKWISLGDAERRRTQSLFKLSALVGLLMNVMGAAIWISASIYEGAQASQLTQIVEEQKRSITTLVGSLNAKAVRNPVLDEHAKLEKFVASTYNGRIMHFKMSNGKTSWAIEIPSWTPQEELAQLGHGIQITQLPNAKMMVSKG